MLVNIRPAWIDHSSLICHLPKATGTGPNSDSVCSNEE